MFKTFGLADEPGGGLDGGFEHHDAGEDGEIGEVVGEVFFGHGDIFGHDDALGVVEGEKLVNENEFQGIPPSETKSTVVPGGTLFDKAKWCVSGGVRAGFEGVMGGCLEVFGQRVEGSGELGVGFGGFGDGSGTFWDGEGAGKGH